MCVHACESERMNEFECSNLNLFSPLHCLTRSPTGGVETIFDEMLKADLHISKLEQLPGFQEIIDAFRDRVQQATQEFMIRCVCTSRLVGC